MYQKNYHIHFIGIGGIGMSGIAQLLITMGYKVSGSDLNPSQITAALEKKGVTIYQGHGKEQIEGANVIVTSTAIDAQNPEVIQAKELNIPIIPRAEMLAELMRNKYSIAISGAHGKTSTTAMVSQILNTAGLDPIVIIGGLLKGHDTNVLHGQGEFIVAEADESDGSFLKYSPSIAAVTNIDLEHLDYYKDIDDIKNKFVQFINSVPFYGLAILCLDNHHVQDILPRIKTRYTTFGMSDRPDFKASHPVGHPGGFQADLQAKQISFNGTQSHFTVFHHGAKLGEIQLNIAGTHNISNALVGIAVAIELNIPFEMVKKALEQIKGVKRRLEIKGEKKGLTVMDDYGHHPTEIVATLTAIRESYKEKRLIVVFQPHRFTRTRELFDEFTCSFYQSDILIVLPIYAASEKAIEGVDAKHLCEGIRKQGHQDVSFAPDFDQALSMITQEMKKGDLILTLGAGDIYTLGEKLVDQI